MDDFFGYNRTAKSEGQIASSEFAVITVGTVQSLVQRVSVNYGHDIRTVFAVGDSNVYWIPGHAMGTLDISTLVGAGGFFAGWKGTKCGAIKPLSISAGRGTCFSVGTSTIRFDGGMLERVTAEITQGQLEMSQGVTVRVASMALG
jgi:hypothetical protein